MDITRILLIVLQVIFAIVFLKQAYRIAWLSWDSDKRHNKALRKIKELNNE